MLAYFTFANEIRGGIVGSASTEKIKACSIVLFLIFVIVILRKILPQFSNAIAVLDALCSKNVQNNYK